MLAIVPAILSDNLEEVKSKLTSLSGVTDRVQIDIIDGSFAENKTINPTDLEKIETDLKIDYHLMVKEPNEWVIQCMDGQANRIIGQIEEMWSQKIFVENVLGRGIKVGLALNLSTPVGKLDPEVLPLLDVILVMSVKAGFGGQEFDMSAPSKIAELDHIRARDNLSFSICDDGGITLENVDDVHIDGVDEVAVGRRIFEGDIKTNIKKYQKAGHGMQ